MSAAASQTTSQSFTHIKARVGSAWSPRVPDTFRSYQRLPGPRRLSGVLASYLASQLLAADIRSLAVGLSFRCVWTGGVADAHFLIIRTRRDGEGSVAEGTVWCESTVCAHYVDVVHDLFLKLEIDCIGRTQGDFLWYTPSWLMVLLPESDHV